MGETSLLSKTVKKIINFGAWKHDYKIKHSKNRSYNNTGGSVTVLMFLIITY